MDGSTLNQQWSQKREVRARTFKRQLGSADQLHAKTTHDAIQNNAKQGQVGISKEDGTTIQPKA
jgi:hypothetical protein